MLGKTNSLAAFGALTASVVVLFMCVKSSSGQAPTLRPSSPGASKPRSTMDRWIDSAMSRVKQQKDASPAIEILNEVMSTPNLTAEQKSRVDKELTQFKGYAEKGLVRNGQTWITSDQAKERIAQSDKLIERGVTFVRLGDSKSAQEAFEEASKTDLNGIRADFILGMLNSPLGAFSPKTAADHFKEILKRSPLHSCAMNNLALSYVRQGEFKEALNLWQNLDQLEPDSTLVVHNVSQMVEDIRTGRLVPTKAEAKSIEKFYVDLIAGAPPESRITPNGWRYANLTLSRIEEDRTRFDDTAVSMLAESGSGILIHPGYVITGLHLVRDFNTLTVDFPGEAASEASLEAVSHLHNLALLKISNTQIPAISVTQTLPKKDAIFLGLGYPTSRFGASVAASRQLSFSGIPAPEGSDYMVFQAPKNRGNSGGPVCDATGNVVGMVTLVSALDGGQTAAVPISHVIAFVEKNVASYKPSSGTDAKILDWDAGNIS